MCVQRVGGAVSPIVTVQQMDHRGCCERFLIKTSIQQRDTHVTGRGCVGILLRGRVMASIKVVPQI